MRATLVFALALIAAGCARDAAESPASAPAPEAIQTRLVRDEASGAELPRLTLPNRPEVERRVNASLDSLSASLACDMEPGADTTNVSFETRAAVTYAADDVFSVSVHSSYFCGGAYPTNDANQSRTFDLTTGDRVPFAALFRDYTADRDAIAGVLQTTLYSAGVEADSSCAGPLDLDAIGGTEFAYSISEDGLVVQPEFPHVIEACAVESTIPFASLRAYAAEGGILARVADAHTPRP